MTESLYKSLNVGRQTRVGVIRLVATAVAGRTQQPL